MKRLKVKTKVLNVIKKNAGILAITLIFSMLEWCVPLASGDDWTFAQMHGGLFNAPSSIIWNYLFFNGRATMHYLFGQITYYFNFWFAFSAFFFFLLLYALKNIMELEDWFSQMILGILFLCISHSMAKEIFLWPIGFCAYVPQFALILLIYVLVRKRVCGGGDSFPAYPLYATM